MTEHARTDAVVIERTFDAPIDLVWAMWTEPEHFAAWYGPTGASIPTAELDVRVGGRRRVCMEVGTPDGPMRMWFAGEHRTVVPPELLVYTEETVDETGAPVGGEEPTEVRVELTAVGDRTRVLMTHRGVPADSPGAAGWQMAFDKLAARLPARS